MLAVDAFRMGVVIRGQTLLYAGLAPSRPVTARAFTHAAMERKIDNVELLFLRLTTNMEKKLAAMLNP